MAEVTMTIDGASASGASRFGVIDPATGSVFEHAPECSREQLDAAMESGSRDE